MLSTAGNLVFQGTASAEFRAYAADTGKQLWSFPTQSGIVAAPMTYSIGGEQYVAVLVGWGSLYDLVPGVLADKSGPIRNISRLMVFKLGAKGTLPAPPPMAKRVLDPPPVTGTPEQIKLGAAHYARYCSGCHGDAAVAGALNPDLRHSGAINSAEAVKAIAIGGALKHKGMVSFSAALKAEDVENIRLYVIKRANEDKALGG